MGFIAAPAIPRQVLLTLTNKSGGSVGMGDVVYLSDGTNSDSFTTGTTPDYDGAIGIAQQAIASNAAGPVLISGYAALVNVNASVTIGHYGATYTAAKQATDAGSSRTAGTFCQFQTGGTTPDAVVWQPDLAGGSSFTNPMTTTGDTIYSSDNSGTPARLAVGGANTVVHGGTTPGYSAVVPGDLDVSADNTTADSTTGHHGLLPKLGGGTTNFLRADGSWAAPPGSGSMSNPMTTTGDIIYSSDGSGTPARLAVGGANVLLHGGTTPAYSAVVEGDLGLTDITTANATTSAHGFLPKLDNNSAHFLNGAGAWSTPAGGGGSLLGSVPVQMANNAASGTSYTITLGSTPTNGNKLILVGGAQSVSGSISSITQTNVTWSQLHGYGANGAYVDIWVGSVGASAGTSIAVVHAAGSFTAGRVGEWAGLAGTLDTSKDATGTSADYPGVIGFLPATAGALIVGGWSCNSGSGTAAPMTRLNKLGAVTDLYSNPTILAAGWTFSNAPIDMQPTHVVANGQTWASTIISVV